MHTRVGILPTNGSLEVVGKPLPLSVTPNTLHATDSQFTGIFIQIGYPGYGYGYAYTYPVTGTGVTVPGTG
jgi:hypothetical protein